MYKDRLKELGISSWKFYDYKAKYADVNPKDWMEDVLKKLPYYLRDNKDPTELLPLNWKNNLPSPQR